MAAIRDRIAHAVLIADPDNLPKEGDVRFGKSNDSNFGALFISNWSNQWSWNDNVTGNLSTPLDKAQWKGRVSSVCASQDIVCDWSPKRVTSLFLNGVLLNTLEVANAIMIHTDGYTTSTADLTNAFKKIKFHFRPLADHSTTQVRGVLGVPLTHQLKVLERSDCTLNWKWSGKKPSWATLSTDGLITGTPSSVSRVTAAASVTSFCGNSKQSTAVQVHIEVTASPMSPVPLPFPGTKYGYATVAVDASGAVTVARVNSKLEVSTLARNAAKPTKISFPKMFGIRGMASSVRGGVVIANLVGSADGQHVGGEVYLRPPDAKSPVKLPWPPNAIPDDAGIDNAGTVYVLGNDQHLYRLRKGAAEFEDITSLAPAPVTAFHVRHNGDLYFVRDGGWVWKIAAGQSEATIFSTEGGHLDFQVGPNGAIFYRGVTSIFHLPYGADAPAELPLQGLGSIISFAVGENGDITVADLPFGGSEPVRILKYPRSAYQL